MIDRFIATFKSARQTGTPLIGLQTPDPAAAIDQLLRNAIAKATPVVVWDVVRGWRPANEPGKQALQKALATTDPDEITAKTGNPVEMLERANNLPDKTVLFAINAHRYLSDASASGAAFVQAVWNLREPFKTNLRTLVLLGPSLVMPPELAGDVLPLDEPLPTEDELQGIVQNVLDAAGVQVKDDDKTKAVDALRGLAAFPAEQATAMAVTEGGLDGDVLWARKVSMISATPGLAVWRGGERLDGVGGNDQVKKYMRMVLTGRDAPRCVAWFDEIEKMMAGASGIGDSSGVAQGQQQLLLSVTQEWIDRGSTGVLFVGPPGAGKSAIAKAVGAEAAIPTIQTDLGGMKASLVGESEQRLRTALKVIDAVGNGRVLFIGTCNEARTLSSALRRRFAQTFYFDLPDPAEQDAIWRIYEARFELQGPRPECEGWTGAEIKQACLLSYRLGLPLVETGQFIVPVAKAAQEEIEALRRQAAGRYLSASHAGFYQPAERTGAVPTGRAARRLSASEV